MSSSSRAPIGLTPATGETGWRAMATASSLVFRLVQHSAALFALVAICWFALVLLAFFASFLGAQTAGPTPEDVQLAPFRWKRGAGFGLG